jgi:pimeloyl-ACP methyl ester carboxylesterase
MRRLVALLVILIAAAITAGCTSGNGAPGASARPSAKPSPSITPFPLPTGTLPQPATLAGYYSQHLDWQHCETDFECSWLVVPVDYTRPDGERFALPVIKLPAAHPSQRVGSLVINPGGPGGSGVLYALGASSGEFTQAVLDRFDIVGFDPRAVSNSYPALRCTNGPELDKIFAAGGFPVQGAEVAATVAAGKLYAQKCEQNAGALLPYVGTANAAKDMDILRATLGQSKLTYLGKSYGTLLGASYAQQFPSRVRALVLDGAVNPSLTGLQLAVEQSEGFENAFGQFTHWCVTRPGCPFGTDAARAVPAVLALLEKATAKPLKNRLNDGQDANGSMLMGGISAALYSRQQWPTLENGLTQAEGGDGTALVELANEEEERLPNGSYTNLSDVATSVDCVDRAWPKSTSAYAAAANEAAKAAPLFGPAIVWGSVTCAYWPVPPSPVQVRVAGAPPILVVGDLHDPATPYEWAQALTKDLSSGVLLGWNGEGHTSYMQGSSCVDDAVDQYLIDLKTPRSGMICG